MSVSEGGDTRADGPDESVMSADMENDDDEVCAHCEQRFGEQDEDTPAEYLEQNPVTVSKTGSAICGPCFYVQRGSFPGSTQLEVTNAIKKYKPVKSKFRKLRRKKVADLCLRPGRKIRHEKMVLKELIKKCEEDYVDFQQVNKLVSLADHIKSLKKQPKKPLTNERDRKKFLKEFYPDLRIVKHPTTGKDCIPVEQDMLMVVGNRTSASKVKEEEYDSKPDAKAAHQRAREAVDVKTNKKEDLAKYQDDAAGEAAAKSDMDPDKSDAESEASSFGGFANDSDTETVAKAKAIAKKKRETSEGKGGGPGDDKREPKDPKDPPVASQPKGKGAGKDTQKAPKESKAARAKQERADKILASASKAATLVDELTADLIWRSVVRTGEVERRLQKSSQAEQDLRGVVDNDGLLTDSTEAKELLQTMGKHRELMSDFKDLCREIRGCSPEGMVKDIKDGGDISKLFVRIFDAILSEADSSTLLDMVSTVAKKLHNAEDFLFFRFLRMKEPLADEGPMHLSFHKVMEHHGYKPEIEPGQTQAPEDPLPWPFLLKLQSHCVSDFFEKLRLPSGPALAQSAIPPWLQIAKLDAYQWLPINPDLFQPVDLTKFENQTGFDAQTMINLQRIIACVHISKGKLDSQFLCLVGEASSTDMFSKSLIMAMNAQSEWRLLWAKVLGAVKQHNERKLADIDLTKFWDAFSPVCEIQLGPENRADHLIKIRHLLDLLKVFGNAESRFSQAQAEEKSRFDEKIAALKDWFQQSSQPDIPKINGVLLGWISAASPEKGDNMDERAKAFKPIHLRLPADLDETFYLQCEMLVVLASFSPDIHMPAALTDALRCCKIFKDYKAPAGEDALPQILSMTGLASTVRVSLEAVDLKGSDQGGMIPACAAIAAWCDSVEEMCSSKSMAMMIASPAGPSPGTPWDYQKMLSPQYHSFLLALQQSGDVKGEIASLAPDLEEMAKKLTLFETLQSAVAADWVAKDPVDPLLADTKLLFLEFVEVYIKTMDSALKELQETHFPTFQKFNDRFAPVTPCAEKWQMTSVAYVFNEQNDQTKESLEQLIAARENIKPAMAALKTLCGHVTSCKGLETVITEAKGVYKHGLGLTEESYQLGGILLIGAVLYNTQSTPADAKETLEMATQSFGITKEKLPAKTQKLLSDVLRAGDNGGSGSNSVKPPKSPKPGARKRKEQSQPEEKGDKPKVKESKRSKEKTEKDSSKSKAKKRKASSSEE